MFECPDEDASAADSSQIAAAGSSVGNSMVTWLDQPNFWAKGRLIVLYVGQDEATIALLNSVLGHRISHGQSRTR